MPRQVVGGPRRRAHQVGEARQQRRMLDDEREIGAAAADGFEQRQQPQEDDLRTGRSGMRPLRPRAAAAPARRSAGATAPAAAGIGRSSRTRASDGDQRVGIGVARLHASARDAASVGAGSSQSAVNGGWRAGRRLRGVAEASARTVARRCAMAGERGVERARPRSPSLPRAVARSSASAGSWCVCWSSRYCSRCSTLRRKRRRRRSAGSGVARQRARAPSAPPARAGCRARAARGSRPPRTICSACDDEFDFADAAFAELDVGQRSRGAHPARGSGDGRRAGPRRRRSRGTCDTRTASPAHRARRVASPVSARALSHA